MSHFEEEVSARMPTNDETRILQLKSGTPVIHLVRTAYATAATPVEVCDTIMAADRFLLAYELPAR